MSMATLSFVAALLFDLQPKAFEHVSFDGIAPTVYKADGEALVMDVKESSSFLLRPFDKVVPVRRVSFEWRGEGELSVASPAEERTKRGDDARLRVGLILSGEAPLIPFFAPSWIKAIRDAMRLPADHMLYLTVGAKSSPGSEWPSPYGDGMRIRVLASRPVDGGVWNAAEASFSPPLKVVGLWLMADGDNSKSSFRTELRKLTVE
jgi:hypothetical protein